MGLLVSKTQGGIEMRELWVDCPMCEAKDKAVINKDLINSQCSVDDNCGENGWECTECSESGDTSEIDGVSIMDVDGNFEYDKEKDPWWIVGFPRIKFDKNKKKACWYYEQHEWNEEESK